MRILLSKTHTHAHTDGFRVLRPICLRPDVCVFTRSLLAVLNKILPLLCRTRRQTDDGDAVPWKQ